eukprot:jgi/Tetstr1/430331/TSEL_020156.t1
MALLARMGLKDPKLEAIVMWKDPKVSGGVMAAAAAAYALLELSSFTVIEMVATLGLIVTIAGVLWGAVAGKLGKSGIPLPEFMTNGISEECARKIVLEEALPAVNKALACASTVVKGENVMMSAKLALVFLVAAKIGHYFSLFTFAFLAAVFMMTVPKLYDTYQTEIDKLFDQVMTKFKEVKKMVMDKLEPVLSKMPGKAKEAKAE